jgi:hypothetical protein
MGSLFGRPPVSGRVERLSRSLKLLARLGRVARKEATKASRIVCRVFPVVAWLLMGTIMFRVPMVNISK